MLLPLVVYLQLILRSISVSASSSSEVEDTTHAGQILVKAVKGVALEWTPGLVVLSNSALWMMFVDTVLMGLRDGGCSTLERLFRTGTL